MFERKTQIIAWAILTGMVLLAFPFALHHGLSKGQAVQYVGLFIVILVNAFRLTRHE